MKARNKNIPALRFKDSTNVLDQFKLADLVTFKSGGTPAKDNTSYWNGDVPWISAASMQGKYYSKSDRTITELGLNNGSKLAPKNSLLLLVRGSMLYNKIPIGITVTDVAFNQDLKNLIAHKNVNTEFLFQWFSAKENLLLDKVVGTGIGAGKLDTQELQNLNVSLPSLPEQQKIASFLSAIDEKIRQHTRRKELLEQYKKGVMQQLFSGKLRFKDEQGKAYPKWEEKRVKDFVLEKKGAMKIGPFGSQLKKSTFVSIGYKVYGQENIFLNNFSFGERFISEPHFNNLKANELHPGDFVISTMGTIGKCSIVPAEIQKGIMDSHMIRLQLHEDKILPNYLSQVFSSHLIQKQVKRFSVGGIMDGLSMGIINKLKFKIPPSIDEQQKIASFLSSIDTKIESVSKQIEGTKGYKKGLLQKMFV